MKKLFSLLYIEKSLQLSPQGILGSSILTVERYLNPLNEELKKLGKNGEATLLYKASRDGHNKETLWTKCHNHKETITLILTDSNSVIGCFCPEKWEDTTGKKNSIGSSGCKDIV